MLIIRTIFSKRTILSLSIGFVIGSILALYGISLQEKRPETYTKEEVATVEEIPGIQELVKEAPIQEPVTEPTPEQELLQEQIAKTSFISLPVNLDEATQRTVSEICEKYDLSFALVMALIETESGFQANVKSRTNDYGLMQINKCNHKWLSETLGITDFLNPAQNVEAGCYILNGLFQKYEDVNVVLMAYNMGENNARKLWKQGIWSSKYTRKIMNREQEFSSFIDGKGVN